MSLLSRLRSSAGLRMHQIPSLTASLWPAVSALSSPFSPALASAAQAPLQTRSVWVEVLRHKRDPKDPSKITFEDPDVMADRSGRAQSAEGLLRRRVRHMYYEKPWMKRKRLKEGRAYRRKKQTVDELTTYIKFQQNYHEMRKGK